MQDNNIKSLDNKLNKILKTLGMSIYETQNTTSLHICNDNDVIESGKNKIFKSKKLFKSQLGFFQKLHNVNYIKSSVEKQNRKIFIELYKIADLNEKKLLLYNYDLLLDFDMVFNLFNKELKTENKAIYFITHYKFKGYLRTVENEEKFINKLYQINKDDFYVNLLGYLSNNQSIYTESLYSSFYQEMLKNFIEKTIPEKRKNLSVFIGDNHKQLKNESLIINSIDDEFVIKLNKTFMQENYVPNLDLNYKIYEEQNKILQNLPEILLKSNKLNLKTVNEIYTEQKEMKVLYVTKEKNKISKDEIINYIDIVMNFWVKNINQLIKLDEKDMINEITKKSEITYFYESLNEKLDVKNIKNKKVKI